MSDTPQPTVPEYREQVVQWLLRRRDKWRRTAHTATGAAAAAASFYGAAYDAAAEGVQNGEPEKRASIDGCQEAAIPGNADHSADETAQLRARVAALEAEKAQLIADGLWLGGLD